MTLRIGNCQYIPSAPVLGGVSINWTHNLPPGEVKSGLVTFTSIETGSQQAIEIAPSIPLCFPLPTGTYRVAVVAAGLQPLRELVEVAPGEVSSLNPVLQESSAVPAALDDVLVGLGASNPNVQPRDLDVPAGTTVVLDADHEPYAHDWQMITITDVDAAKRIIGLDDELWGVDAPRYGRIVQSELLTPSALAAQVAKEYIYGNSATVASWKDLINTHVFSAPWVFPVFTLGIVTIHAGGVLRIGNGSNFFVCEKLRMHITAKLEITGTGPGVVWPLSYESFCREQ